MTVRVERVFEISGTPEEVWEFIADPAHRARAISVVEDFTVDEEEVTWHLELPVPLLDRTVAVNTRDVERRPPEFVRFVGRSRVMDVEGEHELEAIDLGTRVTNRFVVDGKLPGVERFFERGLDEEIGNLERALQDYLQD